MRLLEILHYHFKLRRPKQYCLQLVIYIYTLKNIKIAKIRRMIIILEEIAGLVL